jgi:hypothetical protein
MSGSEGSTNAMIKAPTASARTYPSTIKNKKYMSATI